jgi:hypothetical protein
MRHKKIDKEEQIKKEMRRENSNSRARRGVAIDLNAKQNWERFPAIDWGYEPSSYEVYTGESDSNIYKRI